MSNMLCSPKNNPFLEFLHQLRVQKEITIETMASQLEVEPSILLKIEAGVLPIPEQWYSYLIRLYDLNKEEQKRLRKAINDTMGEEIVFRNLEEINRDNYYTCLRFFKNYDSLDEEQQFIIDNLGFEIAYDIENISRELYDQFCRTIINLTNLENYSFHTYLMDETTELDVDRIKEGIEQMWTSLIESNDSFKDFQNYQPKISWEILEMNDLGHSTKTIFSLQFVERQKNKGYYKNSIK